MTLTHEENFITPHLKMTSQEIALPRGTNVAGISLSITTVPLSCE